MLGGLTSADRLLDLGDGSRTIIWMHQSLKGGLGLAKLTLLQAINSFQFRRPSVDASLNVPVKCADARMLCARRNRFSLSRSSSSARRRSVMSRATFDAPMMRPVPSLIGEMVSEMSRRVPILAAGEPFRNA